jgi:hypothetical protein
VSACCWPRWRETVNTGPCRTGPWRTGHWLRRGTLWLWTYVICATYRAKLIPLYGGYSGRPVRLLEILRWYTGSFREISGMLASTAMIPPAALWLLTAEVIVTAVALAVRLS